MVPLICTASSSVPSKPRKTRLVKAPLYASRTPTCLLNLALFSFPLCSATENGNNVVARLAIPPGETVSCVASLSLSLSLFSPLYVLSVSTVDSRRPPSSSSSKREYVIRNSRALYFFTESRNLQVPSFSLSLSLWSRFTKSKYQRGK